MKQATPALSAFQPTVTTFPGFGPGESWTTDISIINGPNNAGKTTLVKGLGILGVTTITTSDLLRKAVAENDCDSAVIAECLAGNKLAPCKVAVRLVLTALREVLIDPTRVVKMIALDGIGRSAQQMHMMAEGIQELQKELTSMGSRAELVVSAVHMKLSLVHVKRRVRQRITDAEETGQSPRPEDQEGVWQQRFKDWKGYEPMILKAAGACFGEVHVVNMAKIETPRLAAMMYCRVHADGVEDRLELLVKQELERRKALARSA